jgi:HSP20 family molecular chaperone IbpA
MKTTITRRRQAPTLFRTPFFSTPFFSTGIPSLTEAADEISATANDLMQSTFGILPEFINAEKFPVLNLSEGKDEFTVTAELPGMTEKDVNIDYCDGVLTIKGEKLHEEKKEEEDRKYYMWERRFGSFQRALPFPGGIAEDKIEAEFKDGILTVHLPKIEEVKAMRRPIPITNGKK